MSDSSDQGLPSWKSEAQYKFTKPVPKQLWAWEFLRRNAQYRAEWKQLTHKHAALIAQYGPFEVWRGSKLNSVESAWDYSPPRNPGEAVQHWRSRILVRHSIDPIRRLAPVMAAEKWKLRTLYDPRDGFSAKVEFLPVERPIVWDRLQDVDAPAPGRDGTDLACAFAFIDLSKPITPQLNGLRRVLIHRQKERGIRAENKKPSWSKLGQYLRAFDAKAQGAKPNEIAKLMYPAKSNAYEDGYPVSKMVNRMATEATRYVQGGYVDLLE